MFKVGLDAALLNDRTPLNNKSVPRGTGRNLGFGCNRSLARIGFGSVIIEVAADNYSDPHRVGGEPTIVSNHIGPSRSKRRRH